MAKPPTANAAAPFPKDLGRGTAAFCFAIIFFICLSVLSIYSLSLAAVFHTFSHQHREVRCGRNNFPARTAGSQGCSALRAALSPAWS